MKTKQFISGVLSFLTIYCFTLTFTGCSSDDDDDDGQTTVAYRVAEIISISTDGPDIYEDKDLYNYSNERLTEVIDLDKENGIWVENRKTEYDYEGDWVYSKRYYKDGDNWEELSVGSSLGLKIVNGKVVETKKTYTISNDIQRTIFTYNGDKLVKIENFHNGELNDNYVFTYNGENLQDVIEYDYNNGVEEMYYKHAFSYSGGKLSEKFGLYFENGFWVNNDKDVYLYAGNNVIQIDDYDYDNDSWEFDFSYFFSYNSLGLLESISESGEGSTWEETYTYEEGIGNYRLLQGDNDWYYYNNYPTAQRASKTNARPDDRRFNLKRFLMH